MYLVKSVILSAYKKLSTLSEDPTQQGATQRISAIRYFLALDAFRNQTGREKCYTTNAEDKNIFSKCVSDVVALSESIYSPAFYWPLKEHSGDCATGSNFFSAGQVSASKENPSKNFVYPKRSGWPELLNINNRTLSVFWDNENSGYQNLKWYLGGDVTCHVALFVWIARNWDVFNAPKNFAKELKGECQKHYSKELMDVIFPTDEEISLFVSHDLDFSVSPPNIEPNDIERLFQDVSCAKVNEDGKKMSPYLAAIRTKPFILLAGISGTGKSRMVRQLARGCCPRFKSGTDEDHPLYDGQKPGNFEMIPVRPNWHDSTELMGYVSRISGSPKYVITDFIRFLAKAWLYEKEGIPFFLCLDEMNLAPVEQYFAEFLSVIETRKKDVDGRIVTDTLVKISDELLLKAVIDDVYKDVEHNTAENFKAFFVSKGGLPIPSNLVVMGTVNMDETTCTFSRKVLDRAMSFELNDVSDMYDVNTIDGEGDYEFGSIDLAAAKQSLTTGKEACDTAKDICGKVLGYLKAVNEKLDKTAFKIAYRSRNEIMIYCLERINGDVVSLAEALDEVTSMKILSRIEGDSQHVTEKWLGELSKLIADELEKVDGYDESKCNICRDKLNDMKEQVQSGYTSFWMR